MQTATTNFGPKLARATPAAAAKEPDIASASIADALAALHVDHETGLTRAEADTRRKKHGYERAIRTSGKEAVRKGVNAAI